MFPSIRNPNVRFSTRIVGTENRSRVDQLPARLRWPMTSTTGM